jgi:hypothetical protein
MVLVGGFDVTGLIFVVTCWDYVKLCRGYRGHVIARLLEALCYKPWGRFSPSTSVFPDNLHSTNFSTITITYHPGLVQEASMAAVPKSPTAQIKKRKKCDNSGGRGFDSRWGHGIFFNLRTRFSHNMALGSTQPPTEMSTRNRGGGGA